MSIDIHALSGAYAVDALDDVERAEFERHLADCASCRQEVDSLREAAAELASVSEVAAPDRLRASVLQAITEVRPLPPVVPVTKVGKARRWWAASSLVLAASVASAVAVTHPWSTSPQVSVASQVMTAADVQKVSSTLGNGGSLTWYRSRSSDKAVVASTGMPALPASKVYELWLQRPDGSMAPAGFLPAGNATVVLTGEASTADGAGLTVEPAGGSPKPTTTPLAVAGFSRT
jgi:anti-sigma-K factor RskA